MTGVPPEEGASPSESLRLDERPSAGGRDPLSGVGGALRLHRNAKGLSLRQFARQLGVSASFISQLENGKSQPSV
ncbi:helix-turn-helix domain-containing protein, partial [Streptomyces lancefieldiae]